MWDPQRYLVFGDERGRPFRDLMTVVDAKSPLAVVDLGCGPGNLTASLVQRWPDARIVGVDSSAEMVAAARQVDGIDVVHADIREWAPDRAVDVLVSNATLQWVPDHLGLLPRLVGMVAPGGWFAFQVPGNFTEPSHVLLYRLADSPSWRHRLGAAQVARPSSHQPEEYLAVLAALDLAVQVWETTYLHVLPGDDAVLEWVSGTALRPVLAALDDDEQVRFTAEYGELLRAAYPRHSYGTVLPYRRIFAVAHRSG
ncbi:MAG TPA: trans-aconitate 2-methyltransferase [Jiangellaceae bacterium]|nr:trans-aconitate 2-methyltransferase [Jiangellaceae bacterium]